jgi:hypothetical protein
MKTKPNQFKLIDEVLKTVLQNEGLTLEQKNELTRIRFSTALESGNLTEENISKFYDSLKGLLEPNKNL